MNKLEIIATSLSDIIELNAVDYPLDIELCGGMDEDGLTPDLDVIIDCVKQSKHHIRVMIRNHNNGFYYTEDELELMVQQIKDIKVSCQPTGFVFGCLTRDGKAIDMVAMERLCQEANGYSNTFHKAIDRVLTLAELAKLKSLGMSRILTQGGLDTIETNKEIISLLALLPIDVIVGGGVNLDNLEEFITITNYAHIGSAVRIDKSYDNGYDFDKVNKCIKIIGR